MENVTLDQTLEPVAATGTTSTLAAPGAPADGSEILVEDELLIEEISIDGMCGVY